MVRTELRAICGSLHFRNSKRFPAFLLYIVEKALRGEAAEIKERMIGIDVFHRPSDYDTNSDPIVRNAACEVRRRLSLYYAEVSADRPVSIHLSPGSYQPELRFAVSPSSTADAADHRKTSLPMVDKPASLVVNEPAHPIVESIHRVPYVLERSSPRLGRRRLLWIAAALLLLFGGSLWWGVRDLRKNPADDLMSTFLDPAQTVLVVVPQAPALVTGALDKKLLTNWNQDNPDIAAEDLHAMMSVLKPLVDHQVHYQIQIDSTVTLADLRDRPVILIGGPSNVWTTKLLSSLRFHFDSVGGVNVIDSQHPAAQQWAYVVKKDDPRVVVEDCAIFARYHDPTTGGIVMVLAGAGRNGTEAAGELVVSKTLLSDLKQRLPSGWKNRNLEVVLKTTVIGGKTGSPSIVETYLW
jgi:hypothetical protein